MKNICEICKQLLQKPKPDFIDVEKIRVGMKLKNWFKTDYKPTIGEYSPCTAFYLNRKVDNDLIYYSVCYEDSNSGAVDIMTRDCFSTTTLIK